jgi:hypothetical protein
LRRPTDATVEAQVGWVRHYADQRGDRSDEIVSQVGMFGEYFGILLGLTPARNARTYDLLDIVQGIAGDATMVPKHVFACRRPDEIDVRVAPLLPVPGHGAFPSGHATQAFAMATVLAGLVRACPNCFADPDARIELLFRQAHRVAVNRTVAGLHYPMDSRAGAMLGSQVGRIILGLAGAPGGVRRMPTFDPATVADRDFLLVDAKAILMSDQSGAAVPVAPDPLFGWMWDKTVAEFAVATVGG